MIELSRKVRFCLNDAAASLADKHVHGFSGWPAMRDLGRFYQLNVICHGEVDPQTGYFINIKIIDQAVREYALPYLQNVIHHPADDSVPALPMVMQALLKLLQKPLENRVTELVLELSPFYALSIRSQQMDHVIVRQRFEFSAAHRLHVPMLSAEENRAIFGKCNNPSGHGHNYQVEVAVKFRVDSAGKTMPTEKLEALVDSEAIQKLDHKHLNIDVPEFALVNPSVENIAVVIWNMLQKPVEQSGVQLDEVKVWETEKTSASYRG